MHMHSALASKLTAAAASTLLLTTGCAIMPDSEAAGSDDAAESTGPDSQIGPEELPGATDGEEPPPVVDNGPRDGDQIALTFDVDLTAEMERKLDSGEVDTYHNQELLDILEERELPATFFMTGKWMQRYPDATGQIADNADSELANHTFAHKAFTPDCHGLDYIDDPEEMRDDAERAFELLESHGGNQTRYFRFPGLCHDAVALEALQPLGVTVVDGDVVSGDPFAEEAQPIVDSVVEDARPGSIVVMHLGGPNAPHTHTALPHIVDALEAEGYEFAAVSRVLGHD